MGPHGASCLCQGKGPPQLSSLLVAQLRAGQGKKRAPLRLFCIDADILLLILMSQKESYGVSDLATVAQETLRQRLNSVYVFNSVLPPNTYLTTNCPVFFPDNRPLILNFGSCT